MTSHRYAGNYQGREDWQILQAAIEAEGVHATVAIQNGKVFIAAHDYVDYTLAKKAIKGINSRPVEQSMI